MPTTPPEVRAAILGVVDAHYGASAEEIGGAVARLLGFKATSATLRNTVTQQVKVLQTQQLLVERDGLLRTADPPTN